MPGIQWPLTEKGDRSTTGFNKAVFKGIAEGLGCENLSGAISSEKDWRHKYAGHLNELVENLAVVASQDAPKMAAALRKGLDLARAMDFEVADGNFMPLAQAMGAAPAKTFQSVAVKGNGAPKSELVLPYAGRELRGADLDAQCDLWASVGTIEPDAAAAIKAGAQRLGELRGRTFLVLGAGSELGPVRPLLEAGATVAAVATRRPQRWSDLISFARSTAGTLLVPVEDGKTSSNDQELAQIAGADLLTESPGVVDWLVRCGKEASGPVTLSTYLYADGEANVRLTAAADYAAEAAAKALGPQKVSFAYLASGSTTYVIPDEAVRAQDTIFASSNAWSKFFGKRKDCAPSVSGSSLPIYRGFEVLQGPNYALAQCMRQWRAVLLHMEGFVVSTPLTPNCRTESVVHNKTMAVILEGMAYWTPMESFDADTARMAMLGILVTDLAEPVPKLDSPMHIFKRKAFHSGLWRCPFELGSLGMSTWILGKIAPRKQPVNSATCF
eukprot:TRINITY_DN49188_c0_g1_i1.p1 TRINITY_DN49188_c0_g1~~TRINITY_DN49188_c0_g1_i1.p1  ORF type:complete len:499 (-),score=104.02 TRINITY_DN49188_c0_g1_i1:177-1673(-)